jgi:hypothetical protein
MHIFMLHLHPIGIQSGVDLEINPNFFHGSVLLFYVFWSCA